MNSKFNEIPYGVVTGKNVQRLFQYAAQNQFAYPAVNVISTHTINAALAAAKKVNSPIIIQLSYGGASYFIGKNSGLSTIDAAIAGAIAAANYIHQAAKLYAVPVILHTDHAHRELLPWIDGLLDANFDHFNQTGQSLFSSHMIDLSAESLTSNIATCGEYLARMKMMAMTLEIELGCTGGEEDGIDNTHLSSASLYTQPEEVAFAFEKLREISEQFTIAASFGNVHGVYKPGNVKLTPKILEQSQAYVSDKYNIADKSLHFVFHGGSGSSREDIEETINYGVIKMNIDTDIQWAMWQGVQKFHEDHQAYLTSQIGNPDGDDMPNKKYYDPRVWLYKGEEQIIARLIESFTMLNCINRNS